MVLIADALRAHWENEDELRKIGERKANAEWLCGFHVVDPTTDAAMSCRGGVCESDP